MLSYHKRVHVHFCQNESKRTILKGGETEMKYLSVSVNGINLPDAIYRTEGLYTQKTFIYSITSEDVQLGFKVV